MSSRAVGIGRVLGLEGGLKGYRQRYDCIIARINTRMSNSISIIFVSLHYTETNLKLSNMNIQLITKSVYGNNLIYPNCDKSHLLAKLIGKKTFSQYDLNTIRQLGYIVTIH